jgi:Secretion system C-terminal sorting domain
VGGFADGIGIAAQFYDPYGICIDAHYNVYIAENVPNKIRKITPDGTVTTILGTTFGYLDGSASQAQFRGPTAICVDNYNNLYIGDSNNYNIRKYDITNNLVSTFVGSTTRISGSVDGIANSALLNYTNLLYLKNDIIYFSEPNGKIRKITNILSTNSFEENPIKLYPNPNKGSFNMNGLQNYGIEIYDILGQLVFIKKEIENEIETGLKNGIYFIKITSEEGEIGTQKMVVE